VITIEPCLPGHDSLELFACPWQSRMVLGVIFPLSFALARVSGERGIPPLRIISYAVTGSEAADGEGILVKLDSGGFPEA